MSDRSELEAGYDGVGKLTYLRAGSIGALILIVLNVAHALHRSDKSQHSAGVHIKFAGNVEQLERFGLCSEKFEDFERFFSGLVRRSSGF